MPTYDFRCPEGHEFERFFPRISDAPLQVECPECAAVAERLISGGAGLVFKGSGFYITDYGKDGKKDQRERAAKAAAASKSDSGSSAGTASTSTGSSATGSSAPGSSGSSGSSGSGSTGGGAA